MAANSVVVNVLGENVCVHLAPFATFGVVASEGLRVYLARRSKGCRRDLRILYVRSGHGKRHELADDVLPHHAALTLTVVLEGQLPRLSDADLLRIAEFYSVGADGMATLQKLSRRFRALFTSDMAWRNVAVTFAFEGAGSSGTDEEEWFAYRQLHTLPRFNSERIRALAHITSRIRLHYGSLRAPPAETLLGTLKRLGGTCDTPLPRNVVVCFGKTGENSGKDIHTALHFVVPSSAMAYHLDRSQWRPVLRGGVVTRLEASPAAARGAQRASLDPGTLIEEAPISNDFIFRVRRIGDDRLTWVHFNHDPKQPPDDASVHNVVVDALDRCAGHCIVLDYDPDDDEAFVAALTSIFQEFISLRRRVRRGEAARRTRPLPPPVPLLVFLALDMRPPSPSPPSPAASSCDHPSPACEDWQLDRKVKVDSAVARAHAYIASTLAAEGEAGTATALTAWYVQPYDRVALHRYLHLQHAPPRPRPPRADPLTSGVYAGFNWLVRAMQTQAAVEGRAAEATLDI